MMVELTVHVANRPCPVMVTYLKRIEVCASLCSADKLLLLDVWFGKGLKTQFSGQTYNKLFS